MVCDIPIYFFSHTHIQYVKTRTSSNMVGTWITGPLGRRSLYIPLHSFRPQVPQGGFHICTNSLQFKQDDTLHATCDFTPYKNCTVHSRCRPQLPSSSVSVSLKSGAPPPLSHCVSLISRTDFGLISLPVEFVLSSTSTSVMSAVPSLSLFTMFLQ